MLALVFGVIVSTVMTLLSVVKVLSIGIPVGLDLDSYPASGLLAYCIPTLDTVMMYVNRVSVSKQKLSSSF
ncbi:hypothetical protein BDV27DRAFT_127959 [Aspergillus caelatus]|uniref:Uncharacterized protein n=1 Tax=Aspergillus caelatus TaxID=61420 RepID=A0A5N7A5A6_9EURO|nr:uncharacterized protein BDV27DRAFT_127959 [Aspergillus caelatus]KAE8364773.1 hypothetical protein BDV27DRAFT_127959 [Aspergillus caelatus]